MIIQDWITKNKPACIKRASGTVRHVWKSDDDYILASMNNGIVSVEKCIHCRARRRVWAGPNDATDVVGYNLTAYLGAK